MEIIEKKHHNDVEKIVMVILFLYEHVGKAFTSRQIADGIWDRYIFPEGKTIDSIRGEVSSVISMHLNKPGNKHYNRKYPLQILEHSTHPLTFEYHPEADVTSLQSLYEMFETKTVEAPEVDESEVDEKKSNIQLKLDLNDYACEKIIVPNIDYSHHINPNDINVILEDSFIDESTECPVVSEESALVLDVMALDKFDFTLSYESNLIHWIQTSKDKEKTFKRILQIVADNV